MSNSGIKVGTVGWEGDDEHFDLGDKTNDGMTLVKVQLFEGRDSSSPLSPDVGQGHKILCQLAEHIGRIPQPGERVHVSIPVGMEHAPGQAVITAVIRKDVRYNLTDGSVIVTPREGAAKVVVRNDGSVTMFTSDDNTDNGKSVYIRVAKDGIRFVAPWGVIKFDETGFHVTTSSGASFDLGGIFGLPSPMDQLSTYAAIKAAIIDGRCSAASFGSGATPAADATTTMTTLNALQSQISTILTVLGGVAGSGPTGAALSAALAVPAVLSALTAAATAVSTQTTPGTSQIPKGLSSA